MTRPKTRSPALAKRLVRSDDKGHSYTDEEREDAALVCAIAASNPDLAQSYSMTCAALDLHEFDAEANECAFVTLALPHGRSRNEPDFHIRIPTPKPKP